MRQDKHILKHHNCFAKSKFESRKSILSTALIFTLLSLTSTSASSASMTLPEYPTDLDNLASSCIGESCILYGGSQDDSKLITIATHNPNGSFWNYKISLGFSMDYKGEVNNQSVVITSGSDAIKGVIRAASTSGQYAASNNTIYIKSSNNERINLTLNGPSLSSLSSQHGELTDGSIVAASAYNGALNLNRVIIDNSSLSVGSIYAATQMGNSDATKWQSHESSGNLVWISNSDISGVTPESDTPISPLLYATYYHDGSRSKGDAVTVTAKQNIIVIDSHSDVEFNEIGGFGYYYFTDGVSNIVAEGNGVHIINSTLRTSGDTTVQIVGQSSFTGRNEIGTGHAGFVNIESSNVTIDSGSNSFRIIGSFFGSEQTDNVVQIKNSTLTNEGRASNIYGAWVENYNSDIPILATGNTVILDNAQQDQGQWNTLTAAYAVGHDRSTVSSPGYQLAQGVELSDNSVYIINGSRVLSNILVATQLNFTQDSLDFADASLAKLNNNLIYIEDSTFEGIVISPALIGRSVPSSKKGTTEDNTVWIGNNVTGKDGQCLSLAWLAGGLGANWENTYRGNRLVLASPVKTNSLASFQNYQFNLNDLTLQNDAILSVTSKPVILATRANEALNNETSKVVITGTLPESGEVTLIQSTLGFQELGTANELIKAGDYSQTLSSADGLNLVQQTSLVRQQSTLIEPNSYELWIIDADGSDTTVAHDQSLVLRVPAPPEPEPEPEPDPGTEPGGGQTDVDQVNPETDVLMQASVASLASVFASDDLLVDTALKNRNDKRLPGPFAAARAGTWSNDGSSRFETDIYSGLLGWAFNAADVEFGPFIEMGRGNFEMDQGSEGHHNYVGAGIYANWQTPFYVRLTGYIKGGAMESDFRTRLVNQNVDFDNTSAYWGAHLGLNFDINLTQNLRARPFVSYFYDGRESQSFTKNGTAVDGARFEFDAINAHRVQIGSMFEYAYTATSRPYFGITYEQVIKAEANGTAYDSKGGLAMHSSDIEGATGIVSAGWSYRSNTDDFEFNVGVNGYGGARNGLSAQMYANWLF